MPWTLCTKSDVIGIFPQSEAVIQDWWSDVVEDMIREHLGNQELGRQTRLTESYSGDGTSILLVNNPPIVSITSLSINGVLLVASDYAVTENSVQLVSQTFPHGNRNIVLTYLSGSPLGQNSAPVVDHMVRFCAATMLAAILTYRGRAGSDASIKWGGADVKQGEKSSVSEKGLPSNLKTIMRQLLRRKKLMVR